jgi:hypothetical protein
MRYLPALCLLLAVSGCAEHHTLTACQGPYLALTPPSPPPVAEAPKAAPSASAAPLKASAPKQQHAADQGA